MKHQQTYCIFPRKCDCNRFPYTLPLVQWKVSMKSTLLYTIYLTAQYQSTSHIWQTETLKTFLWMWMWGQIAQSVSRAIRLSSRQLTNEGSGPTRSRDTSLHHYVQTGTGGPNQSPLQWLSGALCPGSKVARGWLTAHFHLVLRSVWRATSTLSHTSSRLGV
jgi:hypothetical protein